MARRKPPATPQSPVPPAQERKLSYPARMVQATWKGKTVWRAWPKKATAEQNAKRLPSVQLFIDRVKTIKEEPAATQIAAREMSEGSALLPRDVQIMLMANTFYGVFEIDGERYWPREAMNEVSIALDVLNRTPGAMLYRDSDGWVGLLPGPAGSQLTVSGNPPRPAWVSAPAATNYDLVARLVPNAVSTTAQSCKGQLYRPPRDIEAHGIWAYVNTALARSFSMRLYEIEGDTITAILAQGPPVAYQAGERRFLRHLLAPAITLKAGHTYWVALGVTSSTDGTACNIAYNETATDLSPVSTPVLPWARTVKRFPVVGDTVEVGGANAVPYSAGFDG